MIEPGDVLTCQDILQTLAEGMRIRWVAKTVSGLPGPVNARDLFIGTRRVLNHEVEVHLNLQELVSKGLVIEVEDDLGLNITHHQLSCHDKELK